MTIQRHKSFYEILTSNNYYFEKENLKTLLVPTLLCSETKIPLEVT